MNNFFPFLLSLSLLLSLACGDDAGSGGDMNNDASLVTPSEAAPRICDAIAACGEVDEDCAAEWQTILGYIRPDGVGAMATCWESASCDQTDPCVSVAELGLERTPAAEAFHTDCLERRAACDNAFGDDACYTAEIFRDDIISTLSGCLESECESIRSCFSNAL